MDHLSGVPSAERFGGDDWLPADAIGEIADRLIQTEERFAHLRDRTLVYFWKKRGGTKDGTAILGTCLRITGPLKALAPGADFMIAMSADQWELNGIAIGSHEAEAIVNHELRHAGIREGKPVINPHTAVFFVEEIAEYGLFTQMLQAAGTAFQQLALVAA
jgi:hypothetical protein